MADLEHAAAPWKGMHGDKRILREFKYLQCQIKKGVETQMHDLQLVNDDIRLWRFKLKNFDDDVPGGRQLNKDLAALAQRHGQDHLLMEIKFPSDYPTCPFFLRVITPRCCWYTGHVTAGGSICIEALTLSSSSGAWQPDYCVEAILRVVVTNMIDAEVYRVQTATGPGGLSGPLRIDLDRRWHGHGILTPYSKLEAESAFRRMQAHHQVNGWGAQGSSTQSKVPAGPSGSVPPFAAALAQAKRQLHTARKAMAAVASNHSGLATSIPFPAQATMPGPNAPPALSLMPAAFPFSANVPGMFGSPPVSTMPGTLATPALSSVPGTSAAPAPSYPPLIPGLPALHAISGSSAAQTVAAPGSNSTVGAASSTSANKRKALYLSAAAAGVLTRRQRILAALSSAAGSPATAAPHTNQSAQPSKAADPVVSAQTSPANTASAPATLPAAPITPAAAAGSENKGGGGSGQFAQPGAHEVQNDKCGDDGSDEESVSLSELNITVTKSGVKRSKRLQKGVVRRQEADGDKHSTNPSSNALGTQAHTLARPGYQPTSPSAAAACAAAPLLNAVPVSPISSPGRAHGLRIILTNSLKGRTKSKSKTKRHKGSAADDANETQQLDRPGSDANEDNVPDRQDNGASSKHPGDGEDGTENASKAVAIDGRQVPGITLASWLNREHNKSQHASHPATTSPASLPPVQPHSNPQGAGCTAQNLPTGAAAPHQSVDQTGASGDPAAKLAAAGGSTSQPINLATPRTHPASQPSNSSDDVICLCDDDDNYVVTSATMPGTHSNAAAAAPANKTTEGVAMRDSLPSMPAGGLSSAANNPVDRVGRDAAGASTKLANASGSGAAEATAGPSSIPVDGSSKGAEDATAGASSRPVGDAVTDAIAATDRSSAPAGKCKAKALPPSRSKGRAASVHEGGDDGADATKRVRWSLLDQDVQVVTSVTPIRAALPNQAAGDAAQANSRPAQISADNKDDDDVVILDGDEDEVVVTQPQGPQGTGSVAAGSSSAVPITITDVATAADKQPAAGARPSGLSSDRAAGGAPAAAAAHPALRSASAEVEDGDGVEIVAEVQGAGPSTAAAELQDCVVLVEDKGKQKAQREEEERITQRELELAAQVAELQRRLKEKEEEENNKAENVTEAPYPEPDYWEEGKPANGRVKLVYLPLPGQTPPSTVSDANVDELVYNGFTRQQAITALEATNDDPVAAVIHAVEQMFSEPGAAPAAGAALTAKQRKDLELAKKKKDLEQEVKKVVDRFMKGLPTVRLRAIARVQNPWMWMKFGIRRREILDALAGNEAGLNEYMFWHGTDRESMQCILEGGFDIRVANMHGSLGAGTYFAGSSTYSYTYSQRKPLPPPAAAFGAVPSWPAAVPPFLPGVPPFGTSTAYQYMQQVVQQKKQRQQSTAKKSQPLLNNSTTHSAFGSSQAGMLQTGNMPLPATAPAPQPASSSTRRITRSSKASAAAGRLASANSQQAATVAGPSHVNPQVTASEPLDYRRWPGRCSMMLCRVVLGRVGVGGPAMRKPPPGCDSVSQMANVTLSQLESGIFAVFDNAQAYPEYILHFD